MAIEETPSAKAIAAKAIGSLAIMLISSSFTWMKSKHLHHGAGFGSGWSVLSPFAWIASSREWRSQ